jgi:adenylate cyclase
MSFEIERKFLVCSNEWSTSVTNQRTIRQAYLGINGKTSIRVRIVNNESATLTIKSRPAELRRLELEYPIPVLEAEALMQLREGSVIEKTRYVVPHGDLAWEIDVFARENEGLVIAELELHDVNQQIDLPSWIGEEVTSRPQYYNSFLVQRPFRSWSLRDKAATARTDVQRMS